MKSILKIHLAIKKYLLKLLKWNSIQKVHTCCQSFEESRKLLRPLVEVFWCANPAWRATASPAGAGKIFPLFNLFDWFSPITSLFRTEKLFGRRSLICFLPAQSKERHESPMENAGTWLRLSTGGHIPWWIHPAYKGLLCCMGAGCWPAQKTPRSPPSSRHLRRAEPWAPRPRGHAEMLQQALPKPASWRGPTHAGTFP